MTTYKAITEATPQYDAIVYQAGSYTTAVDKNGNVLSSVLTASQTDNVPIQAAINYACSDTSKPARVYVAPATYYLAATVKLFKGTGTVVSSDFLFDGGSSKFIATSAMGSRYNILGDGPGYNQTMFDYYTGSGMESTKNVVIQNMTLDGTNANGLCGIFIRNRYYPTATLKNVIIRNVTCTEFHCYREPATGYYTAEAGTTTTQLNLPSASLVLSGDDAYNSGYLIRNNSRQAYNRALYGDITDFTESGHVMVHAAIAGQTVGDSVWLSTFKNGSGMFLSGLQDTVIENCIFDDCDFGMYLTGYDNAYRNCGVSKNIKVINCTAIDCWDHSSTYAGIGFYEYGVTGITYDSCQVIHAGQAGIYLGETYRDSNIIVSNCIIDGCEGVGVNCAGATRSANITGCQIMNNWSAGVYPGKRCSINNNIIMNNGVCERGTYFQAGVSLDNNSTGSVNPEIMAIYGNFIVDNNEKFTYTGGSGTPTVGQQLTGASSLKTGTISYVNGTSSSGYFIVRASTGTFTGSETISTPTWTGTLGTQTTYPTQIYGVYHAPAYYAGDYYYWVVNGNTFTGVTTPISISSYTASTVHSAISNNYGYGGIVDAKVYDVFVYQDSTYTYVVDKTGKILYSVAIASATDNLAFDAAVTSCPSGGTILCKGSFTFAAEVSVTKSCTIKGVQGCTITLGAITDGIAFDFDGYTGYPTATTVKAATPALIHRNYLFVTSYANIDVGDLLVVQDSTSFGTTDSLTCGELVRVKSKTGADQVDLYDTLTTGYAAGGDVHIFTPIEVHVKDINFAAASDSDTTYVARFICCADSSMEGCKVAPLGASGIQLDRCYNFSFNGNKMYNAVASGSGYGVSVAGGRNVHITDNHITNCRHPIAGGSPVTGSDASEPVNIFVEGNTLTSHYTNGYYSMCAVDVHAAWSIFIKNNVMVHPIADTSVGDYPATLIGAKYCVIEGNDCENFTHINQARGVISNRQLIIKDNRFKENPYLSGTSYHYMVYETDATGSGSYDTFVIDGNDIWEGNIAKLGTVTITELIITNNTVHSVSTTHQVTDSCGIDVTGYSNIKIENNTINNVGADGIRITSCTGTCKGNKIYNPGRRATGTNYGIQLIGTSTTSVMITDNLCEATDTYMTYGIGETGTAGNLSNVILINRIVRNGGTADYLIAGTNTVGRSMPTTWASW